MSAYPQPQGQPEEPRSERLGPQPRLVPVTHDEIAVRWNPILSGVLIALGVSIVLYALGSAIGLTTARPAPTGQADDILQGAAIWSGVTWLIALFVGGFFAGRLGTYLELRSGILQGTILWALYTLILLFVVSSGIAGIIGAISNTGLPNAAAQGGNVNALQAIGTAATAAWIFFGALVVGWLASIVGGWLGVRRLESSRQEPAAAR